MKKLLVNAKELRLLIGITPETAMAITGFPKPVNLESIQIRYWRVEDVEKWVKSLQQKKG